MTSYWVVLDKDCDWQILFAPSPAPTDSYSNGPHPSISDAYKMYRRLQRLELKVNQMFTQAWNDLHND